MNILFICTGNTCRSPMAEGYLRDLIQKSERSDVAVLSAGLGAFPDQNASAHSVDILKDQGIDISSHSSRMMEKAFLEASDWVLTMTEGHKKLILANFPEFEDKVKTLSEFAEMPGEIGDPFGGDRKEYEKAAEDIQKRVEEVWKKLQS